MVRLAPGRHDQVRREPAQEVRGHRQRPLLSGGAAVDLVRAARRRAVLDRPRREDLPGRQSAHQAGAVLGMADPRGAGPPSRRDLPRRGVHPAEDDAAAGQGRLHPDLHLLHLAQHQAGADRISDRADPGRAEGVHAAELLRQHAGHQPGLPADQRPRGLSGAPRARGDAVAGLRHLQRLRAVRGHADPGQGGVPRFREVRDQGLGLRPARQHPRLRRAPQPDPPRQPGAAGVHQPALLQCLERQHHLLRQDDRGQGQYRPDRGQPRPAPRAGGQLRGAAVGAQPAGLGGRRGRGLFTGNRFVWHGKVQHVWLDPNVNPCAIWRITPPGLPG